MSKTLLKSGLVVHADGQKREDILIGMPTQIFRRFPQKKCLIVVMWRTEFYI
jgi:hypothetical protein